MEVFVIIEVMMLSVWGILENVIERISFFRVIVDVGWIIFSLLDVKDDKERRVKYD